MMKTTALALLFAALTFSPGLSRAEGDEPSLEQLAVEMAHTPAQHLALARHYEAKAAEARAEVKRHADMARSYAGGKLIRRQDMKRHCQSLSEKYAGLADEYEALAKLHLEEAKKTE